MCVRSMVYDYWNKYPWPQPLPIYVPYPVPQPQPYDPMPRQPQIEINWEVVKADIEKFKKSIAAAKVVDDLTAQPDCEDPDKAKLKEKIEALEKRIKQLEAKKK
jgi:hypothetical protein